MICIWSNILWSQKKCFKPFYSLKKLSSIICGIYRGIGPSSASPDFFKAICSSGQNDEISNQNSWRICVWKSRWQRNCSRIFTFFDRVFVSWGDSFRILEELLFDENGILKEVLPPDSRSEATKFLFWFNDML